MAKELSAPGRPVRFFQLDALRGIGALTVVLFHLSVLWAQETQPTSPAVCFLLRQIAPFGTEAIMFFFLLSGFVLSLSAIDGRPQPWPAFVVRRIFRIYVPYLGALAVAVAGAFWLHGTVTRSTWFHSFWSQPVDWRLVGQHVLFVGAYDTRQFDNPIWSLVHEMRISLIFPALCWLVLRFRSRWSLVIAGAFSGVAAIVNKGIFPPHWGVHTSVQIAGLFVFGIFLARERHWFGGWYRRAPKLAKLLAGSASIWLFLFGGTRLIELSGHLFGRASMDASQWITAVGAGGIMMVSLNSYWCQKVLAWPWMQFLARISYSLYLWHFIVLLFCVHLFYGQIPFIATLGLAFVLMIPVSWLSYRWVELPANALGRKLAGVGITPPAASQTPGFEDRRMARLPGIDGPAGEAVADTSAA